MNVTNSIIDFFQGNPFNNTVGSYIEKATDSRNEGENWSLFMEICDVINSMEDGPKLAIRAIKRLLTTDIPNNTTTILYTLVLLETCVKNCGYRFHLVVCNRDFLQDLEKLVLNTQTRSTRQDVAIVVRDRVLLLLQIWFETFKGQPDLRDIESIYINLHECGVQFPSSELAKVSPIITPTKTVQPSKEVKRSVTLPAPMVDNGPQAAPMTDIVIDELSKNLLVVQGNIDVMSELIRDYPPLDTIPDDVICLMKNLETVCQQMQMRLIELVNMWDETDQKDSSVLFDLLRVNDEMNNVLIQYGRYERARLGQSNKAVSGDELGDQMAKSSLSDTPYPLSQETSEFYDGSTKTRQSRTKNDKIVSLLPHSSDEMEPFISKGTDVTEAGRPTVPAISSQEFDQFLTEQVQNSSSANGDSLDVLTSGDRQRIFGEKPRDSGKELLDL